MLDKANDRVEFIRNVAEELEAGMRVYYNLDTLEYGPIMKEWIYEYGDYLDLADKYFEEEISDWNDDDKEFVTFLHEAVNLGHFIEQPDSHIQFNWMEDFTEEHSSNEKFYHYAVKALNQRHPFSSFKQTLNYNRLDKEWYAYKAMRMQQHVISEIPALSAR